MSNARVWLVNRPVDLIVGCGLWSAPLLVGSYAVVAGAGQAWGSLFYALALVCNYPHFMATIYRAYGQGDRGAHRLFTVYATGGLVLAGAAALVDTRLVPWVFTAYIFWSPWHYTGQNYGILMMFLRRAGVEVSDSDRRLLRTAFVASYVMLLASFNEGLSADPFVLSLDLVPGVAWPIQVAAGLVFIGASLAILRRWWAVGLTQAAAPLTVLSTQALWFVVPTILSWTSATAVPQTRYSTGILAVMHSAQYLWVTQYFTRRDAPAWNGWRYATALVLGGIALFVPLPWLTSLGLRTDFTISVLVVTAIVNLHHFVIDGVVWKLRQPRVARVLVSAEPAGDRGAQPPLSASPSPVRRLAWAAVAAALLSVAFVDQVRYWLTDGAADLAALERAAAMNPFDDRVQMRRLRTLLAEQRRDDARQLLDEIIVRDPRHTDALVNRGVIAAEDGQLGTAADYWQRALSVDERQPQVQLYLAEALDREGRAAEAASRYHRYLEFVVQDRRNGPPDQRVVVPVVIRFGDALVRAGRLDEARQQYALASQMAAQTGLSELEIEVKKRLEDRQP